MNTALRQRLVVQPGGVIEIRSPELPVGATAEVIVILDIPAPNPPRSATPEELGWPPGFFERTAGSIPDFPDIESEGDYETRESPG